MDLETARRLIGGKEVSPGLFVEKQPNGCAWFIAIGLHDSTVMATKYLLPLEIEALKEALK
jgi:hypothetical protein